METAVRMLRETLWPPLQVTVATVNKDACLPSAMVETRGLCLAACEKGLLYGQVHVRCHLGNKDGGRSQDRLKRERKALKIASIVTLF